ncbi:MAG: hypothetical protein ACD_12C00504G0001, partial [uncultured bacterium]
MIIFFMFKNNWLLSFFLKREMIFIVFAKKRYKTEAKTIPLIPA